MVRFYSLSDAPNGRHYRITVKKEPHGVVSTYLHTHVTTGSMLEVMVRIPFLDSNIHVDESVDYVEPGGRYGTLSCLLGPALSFLRHWSLPAAATWRHVAPHLNTHTSNPHIC